jgi:hypothetical protein
VRALLGAHDPHDIGCGRVSDNPFRPGARVQFRNILVRRDHPDLRHGTVTDVHHHTVEVAWDPKRPDGEPVAGSYHHSSLTEWRAS